MLLEIRDALFSREQAFLAFKRERLGNNTDSQSANLASNLGYNWAGTSTSPTTHTSRDEDHIRAFKSLVDLLSILFSSLAANARIATRTKATSEFIADANTMWRIGEQQGLSIGINRDKLDAHHICLDHAVHRITAPSADTDNTDLGEAFKLMISHW